MTKPLNNLRYGYIDAVKGCAILCITLLHFEEGVFPWWLNVWIGLFMITAFYFTSGWVFSIKSSLPEPTVVFKKRLRQLGIPYLWFSLLILVFDVILVICKQMELKMLLRDIYKTLCLRGIGTLWFLPVLLFGELIFCWLMSLKKRYWIIALFFIVSLVVNYLFFRYVVSVRNVSDMHRIAEAPLRPIVWSLLAWPVIGVGFIAGKYLRNSFSIQNKLLIAVIGWGILMVSLWFVLKPPFQVYYVNNLIVEIFSATGLLFLFAVCPPNPVSIFLEYWGRNSLILMCTHFSISEEICKLIDRNLLGYTIFCGYRTLLYFAITVLLTYPMVWVCNHKLSFMLGKNYDK